MAIMYPEKPKEFEINSHEDMMFNALANLPDSYYVFHSFSIVNVIDNQINESETDFVVFNPQKGILCIEAKAGNIKYENGQWKYGSDILMKHDGPFNQAKSNKWKIKDYIINSGFPDLLKKCKLLHAVWFPSVSRENLKNKNLPSEADLNLILTQESINNIEEDISKIFDIELQNEVKTLLSDADIKNILNNILAPSFNLISLSEIKLNHKRQVFKTMLKEQVALLNYLEEQNTAVINGMAGTGKTVIGIEKAKRHAMKGEKVLFLCYNKYLKDFLQREYAYENIYYYTIDGLACSMCETSEADYDYFQEILYDMYYKKTFPYQHIIIDEGQDFGRENIEESEIINLLKANVLENENIKGSFYLFYDKNQMIQSLDIPEYIRNADCKLTLYRNCRNTLNIATTSLRFLKNGQEPKLFEGAIRGENPEMYFVDDLKNIVETLNKVIEQNIENGYENIQILTCATEASSIIANECSKGAYIYKNYKIPFTTCRKYKGLEADAIIVIDMDKTLFETEIGDQIFYVGSSRARYKLSLIANLNEEECNEVLDSLGIKKTKNIKKFIATAFNAKYTITEEK